MGFHEILQEGLYTNTVYQQNGSDNYKMVAVESFQKQ